MSEQSPPSKYRIRPRYLEVSTFSRICTCSHSSVHASIRAALEAIWRRFLSVPLLHILMPRFPDTSMFRGANISHFPHWGWRAVPLFSKIIVSSTFCCIKYICRLVQLVDLLGHPSTGQSIDVAVLRNSTRYSFGLGGVKGGSKVIFRPDRPCCVCRWAAIEAAANSASHYSHTTLRS